MSLPVRVGYAGTVDLWTALVFLRSHPPPFLFVINMFVIRRFRGSHQVLVEGESFTCIKRDSTFYINSLHRTKWFIIPALFNIYCYIFLNIFDLHWQLSFTVLMMPALMKNRFVIYCYLEQLLNENNNSHKISSKNSAKICTYVCLTTLTSIYIFHLQSTYR